MNSHSMDIKDLYVNAFNKFEHELNESVAHPFHHIRKNAISRVKELGFPSLRNEEWKYTNISPILKQSYQFPADLPKVKDSEILSLMIPTLKDNTLVFLNGHFIESLSSVKFAQKNVIISPIQNLLNNKNSLIQDHLTKYADYQKETFTALNTAFIQDGIFIYIPEGLIVEDPIHILNISDPQGTPFQSFPRNLIIAGKGSQVMVIERQQHLTEGAYLRNSVTEVVIEEDAMVRLITVQDESREAFIINRTQVTLETNSNFSNVALDLGGSIVRNNLGATLNGEHCEANLFGFYLASQKQHIDNHTNIEHLQPNCDSNELYKGILTDQGRAVFSGTIYVARDAQKTNALQANHSLLLSDESEVDSKPQLKIFADDVKCTHGATIGQMDEEAIFYLRQRGIDKANAHTLLRSAFAGEIIEKIDFSELREYINSSINKRLSTEF